MNKILEKTNVVYGMNNFKYKAVNSNNDLFVLADKCAKINNSIKEQTVKLNELKKELKMKMSEKKLTQIKGNDYRIKHTTYKNEFNSALSESFNDLGNDLKRSLLKSGLISISFKLKTENYKEMKDNNEESPLDMYVKKRKVMSALSIYYNNS